MISSSGTEDEHRLAMRQACAIACPWKVKVFSEIEIEFTMVGLGGISSAADPLGTVTHALGLYHRPRLDLRSPMTERPLVRASDGVFSIGL